MAVIMPPKRLVRPAQAGGAAAGLWRGLLSYWPLWDGVGSRAENIGPLPYSAVSPGGSNVWDAFEAGRGARFDGTLNTALEATDNGELTVNTYSVAFIMRFSDAFSQSTDYAIIGRSDDSTRKGWWFGRIAVDAKNDIRFGTSTGNIKANVADWKRPVLVVLVQRSDSDAAVYTDGNLNVQGNNGFNGPATSATPLQIGTRADLSDAFLGHISNVAFWDRALSDAEIALLARDPFIMLRSGASEIAALSGAAAGGGVTGSGGITIPVITASAAATTIVNSSSSIQTPSIQVQGQANQTLRASGNAQVPVTQVQGQAGSIISASGSVTIPTPQAQGSVGDQPATGSGDAQTPAVQAQGQVGQVIRSSGGVTIGAITATGVTLTVVRASGSASVPKPTAQGQSVPQDRNASGNAAIPGVIALGTVTQTISASGAIILPALIAGGSTLEDTVEVTLDDLWRDPSIEARWRSIS